MLPITGYADRYSVAPGESIAFKVSSTSPEDYEARLVRVICGDPNPAGPGIREPPVEAAFAGRYPSRVQPIHNGSWARVAGTAPLDALDSFTVTATIWPTLPGLSRRQGLVSRVDDATGAGFTLEIDEAGSLAATVSDGTGAVVLGTGKALRARAWYRVFLSYDVDAGEIRVGQLALAPALTVDDSGTASISAAFDRSCTGSGDLAFAARAGSPPGNRYNGKLEAPRIVASALDPDAAFRAAGENPAEIGERLVAAWDFSREMSSARIVDTGPHAMHGETVNLPTRAMKGSGWTGEEMCWRHTPAQYGAIHFHDDDLYDCGWDTDFTFDVPEDFRSGVYAVRLRAGGDEDMVPFFVRAAPGRAQSDACVLIPVFTYTVYANFARGNVDDAYRDRVARWGARPWTPDEHPEYGISTYNSHSDGSGVAYSSRLRPILNQRSGFCAYADPLGGSCLRHFPADTHLLAWLDALDHDFDVVTDEDLDADGVAAIEQYKVVMTGSHPEYHTPGSLDALTEYTEGGGRLMYLGGNGFYWRVAVNPELPGAVEIRRGEGGIRAWAAEPGEYYNAFDGGYGGLWRNSGRAPQRLAGVGFIAQGDFHGTAYRRLPASRDPRAAWIFEGIDDELLGDFGLSGGGAAGFELDWLDPSLGSPPHALVLARSGQQDDTFMLVPEEILNHYGNRPGLPAEELIRSEIVFFETPNGGAVFSVGSITFCGSLPHNEFDNNISRMLDNVLRRFRTG